MGVTESKHTETEVIQNPLSLTVVQKPESTEASSVGFVAVIGTNRFIVGVKFGRTDPGWHGFDSPHRGENRRIEMQGSKRHRQFRELPHSTAP